MCVCVCVLGVRLAGTVYWKLLLLLVALFCTDKAESTSQAHDQMSVHTEDTRTHTGAQVCMRMSCSSFLSHTLSPLPSRMAWGPLCLLEASRQTPPGPETQTKAQKPTFSNAPAWLPPPSTHHTDPFHFCPTSEITHEINFCHPVPARLPSQTISPAQMPQDPINHVTEARESHRVVLGSVEATPESLLERPVLRLHPTH